MESVVQDVLNETPLAEAGSSNPLQDILNSAAHLLGVGDLTLGAVFRVAVIALVGWVLIKMLTKMADRLLDRSRHLVDIRVYIRSALRIFLWFLLALILLDSLGIPMTSVIALLSVAGLAVSLALQNSLANLAGGLMILVTKPFVVGDYVETDGTAGVVSEIGLAYTKLTTYDGKRIAIPNSQVSAAKIVNYTNQEGRRVDVNVSASYDAPTETVKTAIREVVDSIPAIRSDPAPAIWITNYGNSSIGYVVRVWTSTEEYWNVHNNLLEGIRESFARHGVEMTYDHLNVHMIRE